MPRGGGARGAEPGGSGSSRSEPAWTSCSSLVLTGSAGAVSRLAGWEGRVVRGPGKGRGSPSAAWQEHMEAL